MAKKNVYFFGGGKADGKGSMKNLLGGKGANLAEMAGHKDLKLPVPPGFTITTEVCTYYYQNKRSEQFWDSNNIKWIENGLLREMSLVSSGNREKIKVSLIEDNVYQEAVDILLDPNRYYDIFEPNPESVEIEPIQE